ncbi:hypothetical protein QR680_016530 [Steinernema hermaphroditum]|uniref:Uncharacterized protein n=1 Tax=Steinernema hermaphroditum TaxID=289476 RepID=A0AA39LMQ7_9BILA|nr:hypothetical protein QR680_016530 [Steinernema hermaphroditum]
MHGLGRSALISQKEADFQKMDCIPPVFYNEVFGQLPKNDIQPAQDLPGAIGILAIDHYNQRRELKLLVSMSQESRCYFKLLDLSMLGAQSISFSDLRSKYDRVESVILTLAPGNEAEPAMPLESALRKISLALRLAANCEFENSSYHRLPKVFCTKLFKILARSQTFTSVKTMNHGKECEEFVRKQMESVHLEVLSLGGVWPYDFNELIASFTRKPKLYKLSCYVSNISINYKTVVSLLHRWADGDLKDVVVNIRASFDKHRILRFLDNLGCTQDRSTFKLAQKSALYFDTKRNNELYLIIDP